MPSRSSCHQWLEAIESEAVPHVVPICDGLLTGFLPEDKGPYASYPEYSRLSPALGAIFTRGRPVQDPSLTLRSSSHPWLEAVGVLPPVGGGIRSLARERLDACLGDEQRVLELRRPLLVPASQSGPLRAVHASGRGIRQLGLRIS